MDTITATPPAITLSHLSLDSIDPSTTPIQARRRARFTDAALEELAQSIRSVGVAQPIVVIPTQGRFEIVAGERRWLAARRAGLDTIPATVRDLTPGQALEIQLVENLQRDGLHPLEEAEGYAQLRELNHINADDIAAKIGKSRAYVYARLKLLALIPEAKAALESGALDPSRALPLARLRSPKLQKKGLEIIQQRGESWSHRAVIRHLADACTTPLDRAPFPLDRADIITAEDRLTAKERAEQPCIDTPCTVCPHNSHNDPELQADLDDKHVCTHPPCHAIKVVRYAQKRIDELRAQGITVLTGSEALAAIPAGWQTAGNGTWLDLDDECELIEFPEPEPEAADRYNPTDEEEAAHDAWEMRASNWHPPTYRALLADHMSELIAGITAAVDRDGKIHELVLVREAAAALKKHHNITLPGLNDGSSTATADDAEADAAEAQRQAEWEKRRAKIAAEQRYRMALLRAVAAKWKGGLTQARLAEMCERGVDAEDIGLLGALLHGDPANLGCTDIENFSDYGSVDDRRAFAKLKDHELQRLLALASLIECLRAEEDIKPLDAEAKRLRIDTKKIRQTVQAAIKAEAKAKKEAADD